MFKVAVLVLLGSTLTLQQCNHALKTFEAKTGLDVQNRDSFSLCRNESDDHLDCKPTSTVGTWQEVENVPNWTLKSSGPVDIDDINVREREQLNEIKRQVYRYYLGTHYTEGAVDDECNESFEVDDVFNLSEINGSIMTFAQVRQEEILKSASAEFEAMLNLPNVQFVGDKRSAEASFESVVRDSISSNSSNSADVMWIGARIPRSRADIIGKNELSTCVADMNDQGGSIISGVAGFVILNNDFSSVDVSENIFRVAARIALTGSEDGEADGIVDSSVIRAAGARWSRNARTEITSKVGSNILNSTFYPLWMEFLERRNS